MKIDVMRKATRTAPSVLGVLWSMGLSIDSLHFSSVEEEFALSRSWRTAWARLNVGGNLRLQDVSPSVTLQTPKSMLMIILVVTNEVALPDAPNLYQSGMISAVASSHSSPQMRPMVDRGHWTRA